MTLALTPGLPYPLGATLADDGSINFAVVSEHATAIELCLFDGGGLELRLELPAQTDGVFHGALQGPTIGAGLVYGYRAHGPYAPRSGHRFNPAKLLLDPYAREIVGAFTWDDRVFGYQRAHPDGAGSLDSRDSAPVVPKARVAAPLPPAGPGIRVPAADTVLYELHVKGFSRQNHEVPTPLRGTYAGLAHAASIEHLRRLGVTTLCLMPVHYAISERHLASLGLRNYWGYNTLGWLCPDPRLSSRPDDPSATRAEFRAMVDALHAAGFEVVLDVVYNHSAEGNELGPTLSLRGLDNHLYYRLAHDDLSRCVDWSGCGNTLDTGQPRVVQLVLDSLREWVTSYGVDGFRFDLAPVLGRNPARGGGFDPNAPLLVALRQDPILARTKLIAEPWDVGPDGYLLGRFPGRFLEWNDRYRDGLRRFWLQRGVSRGELARRIAGSSDRFHHGLRRPSASINFITAHDGFTLLDVVSYARKHNLANGEHDRDGHDHNFSINCGVEGPSHDPIVVERRARLRRALLASLFVSQGTPMLLAGDELGHTQGGNNNAYCQDNPTSWLDWSAADPSLLAFVRACIELRRSHPALRRDLWLRDDGPHETDRTVPVEWRRPDGASMRVDDWHDDRHHCLGLRLGDPDDALLLLFNAELDAVEFTLPPGAWTRVLDSATPSAPQSAHRSPTITVAGESLLVLARVHPS